MSNYIQDIKGYIAETVYSSLKVAIYTALLLGAMIFGAVNHVEVMKYGSILCPPLKVLDAVSEVSFKSPPPPPSKLYVPVVDDSKHHRNFPLVL